MNRSQRTLRPNLYCIGVGAGLMNFALIFHPMDPFDFLLWVGSAPWETFQIAYGIQAVVLFWIGMTVMVAGCIRIWIAISMRHRFSVRRIIEHTNDTVFDLNYLETEMHNDVPLS